MEGGKENLDCIVSQAIQRDDVCLSLESLDLEEVPKNILTYLASTSLKVLKLEYNDLRTLPDEIGLLSSLEGLYLTGNQLERLPKYTGQLCNLRQLQVNENSLKELPETLNNLHHLKVLDIVGNNLEILPDEFGLGLKNLSEFRADENSLCVLPETFTVLSNLTVLELAENKLTKLPVRFGKLHNLKILNLSQNKIEELPSSFCELQNLVSIDITDNHMKFLMEDFKSAENLKYFHAANNLFKTLPQWFNKLYNIVELSLSNNELNDDPLPQNFGNTAGNTLVSLDLSGNKITALPDSIGQLKKLQTFHLGSTICELERKAFQNGNWLPRLPTTFGQMRCLTTLHLDENQLGCLPESFGSLRSLEWLDVSQNLIHQLPNSFCSLTNLWYLQFSKNCLETLPEDFGNLCNLVDLRLDSNKIASLPESFAKLQKVQTVDLFRNNLTEIPKVLLRLRNLQRLDLDGNNLRIKEDKVPKLTTPVQYAPRNPTSKDTWRGKIREDKKVHFTSNGGEVEKNILTHLIENAVFEEKQDDDSGEECNFSERVFEMAMRRGLSIWRSHTGPDSREERFSPQEESFRFVPTTAAWSLEIYEDASDLTDSVDSTSCEDHQHILEDWDREVENVWQHTYIKKGIKLGNKGDTPIQDQLQDILHSYPPAKQAFTNSAMYESVYRKYAPDSVSASNKTVKNAVTVGSDGQFEDAEE